jgi:hypothetical protein
VSVNNTLLFGDNKFVKVPFSLICYLLSQVGRLQGGKAKKDEKENDLM